jgi:hypothetical protein
VGRQGLLYAGDGKMAALATRAEIAAHHDCSLMPLPLTGETATQVEQWITAIVAGAQEATRLWDGKRWLGAGYACERPRYAMVDGEPVCWTERVQVVRSPTLAQRQQVTLEKRLAAVLSQIFVWRRCEGTCPGRWGEEAARPENCSAAVRPSAPASTLRWVVVILCMRALPTSGPCAASNAVPPAAAVSPASRLSGPGRHYA